MAPNLLHPLAALLSSGRFQLSKRAAGLILSIRAASAGAYRRLLTRSNELLISIRSAAAGFYRRLLTRSDELLVYLLYFISLCVVGFLILRSLALRRPGDPRPTDLDFFFTAVSAGTLSSMATLEMELFSDTQLLILAALIFAGGEAVVSSAALLLRRSRILCTQEFAAAAADVEAVLQDTKSIRTKAMLTVSNIVLGYIAAVHVTGTAAIAAYMRWVPAARGVLDGKGIDTFTFALFTAVSTFSSCGFLPTNENMAVFRNQTGLLLLVAPLAVVGNTLYPPALRLCVAAVHRATGRDELRYALNDGDGHVYPHLLPRRRAAALAATVVAIFVAAAAVMCWLEWDSPELVGLKAAEKVVNAVFVAVNARHAGESTVDLSTLSPALLVVFLVMIYLPPYTTFAPEPGAATAGGAGERSSGGGGGFVSAARRFWAMSQPSQLSFVALVVFVVCIVEKEKLEGDPLNFNVLSITLEVVSAYGNVGFSLGYSCARQLRQDGTCTDKYTGLAGRWSAGGKLVLIFVMFVGRMKKKIFSINAGTAWKLDY